MKLSHIWIATFQLNILPLCQTLEFQLISRYTKPHPKPADERHCMVCWTGNIEDEIQFLCRYKGYKDLRSNFIRYLELNNHTTNLEDSDSKRDLFRTKKTNILISFGKFIAECYRIRETSSNDIWNVGGMYACFVCLVRIASTWQYACFML